MFVHETAEVLSKQIGEGTRIWQFCVVLERAHIGQDCNICSHCFIENEVHIGHRVTVKSGVQLWDGIHLDDDVFVGPNVTFTNDQRPRSRQYPERFPVTRVRRGASIGANATILPGLNIGCFAMIGAGSVVTSDVIDHAMAFGSPARINGWVCRCGKKLLVVQSVAQCSCGLAYQLEDGILQMQGHDDRSM